ncbi:TRAPP I complex [Auricularia subglabra TFB-10046 SS5]|nr:TRAPP I complex [Auricularia subglabra TFB-10046 SS5]
MSVHSASHPRLSVLSTSSLSASSDHMPSIANVSARYSLPAGQVVPLSVSPSPKPLTRPNIYDRNLNKTRTAEVSLSAYAFLFSEIVQYTLKRVNGIADLERRLNVLGYRIGIRVFELMSWRAEASTKAPKREIRFLPALMSIHTQFWRAVFGKPADGIEKSVENEDEYMIIDNDPPITRFISIPRDMNQLSCSAITAGMVEAVLDGLGFPARVTAHSVPTTEFPQRTTILIKLDKSVLEREEALK